MKSYKGYTPKERMAVMPLLRKAGEEGRLPPLSKCEVCGQTEGRFDYHSDDYAMDTVLDNTRVLCYNCHMVHHIYHNNSNNAGAKIYIQNIRAGRMFKANNGSFARLTKGLNYLKDNCEVPEEELENI